MPFTVTLCNVWCNGICSKNLSKIGFVLFPEYNDKIENPQQILVWNLSSSQWSVRRTWTAQPWLFMWTKSTANRATARNTGPKATASGVVPALWVWTPERDLELSHKGEKSCRNTLEHAWMYFYWIMWQHLRQEMRSTFHSWANCGPTLKEGASPNIYFQPSSSLQLLFEYGGLCKS